MRRESTSTHLPLDCPRLKGSRNDLLAVNVQNIRFDPAQLPHLATFLRRTGLGLTWDLRDRKMDSETEVEDLGVGPIGDLTLDLDL